MYKFLVLISFSIFINLFNFAKGADESDKAFSIVRKVESSNFKSEIVKLFSRELSDLHSNLNLYLDNLKNEGSYNIVSEINADDIIFLESGFGNGKFSSHYIILIRGYYKSNSFIVGQLNVTISGIEEDDFYIQITGISDKFNI